MSWLEHFPKFNKQGVSNKNALGGKYFKNYHMGGTSIRDLRVTNFRQVKRWAHTLFDKARISYLNFLSFFSVCVSHVCAVFAALGSSLT